jgi:hypothetical protein
MNKPTFRFINRVLFGALYIGLSISLYFNYKYYYNINENRNLSTKFNFKSTFTSTKTTTTIKPKITNSRHFKESNNPLNRIQPLNKKCKTVWNDAPNLTILCRAYSGSIMELYNVFLIGYHLFWPKYQWLNSDLVVVLDDESELDHRLGTVLNNLPPYPKVYFEKVPQQETFCSDDRRAGYSRQQYSNFYSDLYTDKEYIGIVDSDTFYMTPVIPENLFVDGKPRIYG